MSRASPNPHENPTEPQRHIAAALLLLALGLLLRIYFLRRWPYIAGDSTLYQDIAQNWLHAHVYGLSTATLPRPTLIRLPGYPAVLAALSWLFDRWLHPDSNTLRSFLPVLWLQVFADLATCVLIALLARKLSGPRAGLAALALACLCPFTANYTAVPLTETFTLFFLALAFLTLAHWCERPSTTLLMLVAISLSASILLRPDQGLLAACILPAMVACRTSVNVNSSSDLSDSASARAAQNLRARLIPVILCGTLATLPFVPWTLRNWSTFHAFQPLAPKLANDPGEAAPLGFQRWYRTWAIDFSSTQDAYWKYPEESVRMGDLPDRAFDTPRQRIQTAALLQQAALSPKLNTQVETGFQAFAAERIRAHPVRYYVLLPAARLTNMLFHPRTEMLPVAERWWQFRAHPKQTLFALLYAALNLAYIIAAFAGLPTALRTDRTLAGLPAALRTNRILIITMLAYIALRCVLLLTLDNAEQRYTLEFFPILITLAAALALPDVFINPE